MCIYFRPNWIQIYYIKKYVFFQRSRTNPLNVITLGQTKNDNINLIITIKCDFNRVIFSKWDIRNVITLSG